MISINKFHYLLFFTLVINHRIYSASDYILPVADYIPDNVSPVSIRGNIIKTGDSILTVQCDNCKKMKANNQTIRIIKKTDIFTTYGGHVYFTELCLGQYIWVWYITKNFKKAGNPPQAAAIIIWSKDPKDKPTAQIKETYDIKKTIN